MGVELKNLLKLRCPVCGKGKVFHGYLDTPDSCPECGFYFMRETGYFLPHAPISYLVIVSAAAFAWAVLRYILHIESDAIVLSSMVVFAVAFGFWSNRYTKMMWMAIDLTLHPPTKEDFQGRGREKT
jgi:uncharacterized protein (DUF983 family)